MMAIEDYQFVGKTTQAKALADEFDRSFAP